MYYSPWLKSLLKNRFWSEYVDIRIFWEILMKQMHPPDRLILREKVCWRVRWWLFSWFPKFLLSQTKVANEETFCLKKWPVFEKWKCNVWCSTFACQGAELSLFKLSVVIMHLPMLIFLAPPMKGSANARTHLNRDQFESNLSEPGIQGWLENALY